MVVYALLNFSQCRDWTAGFIWEDFKGLTTARAREFWICWVDYVRCNL